MTQYTKLPPKGGSCCKDYRWEGAFPTRQKGWRFDL